MRFSLIILLGCWSFVLQGQDLIVTNSGDSIDCVITDVAPYKIRFYSVEGAGKKHRSILLDQVSMYRRSGYFPVTLGALAERKGATLSAGNRWMTTVSMGWGFRTTPMRSFLTPEDGDYLNGSRQGFCGHVSLHNFVTDNMAIGIEYSSFFGSGRSIAIDVDLPNGTSENWRLADNVRMHWANVNLLLKFDHQNDWSFGVLFQAGPLFYQDEAISTGNLIIRGRTLALGLRPSAELRLSDKWAIGAHVGYVLGRLEELTCDTGRSTFVLVLPKDSRESVSRVDIGVELRMRL